MASLRRAANTDMRGWEPAPQQPQNATVSPPGSAPDQATSTRAPNMLASMPLMASTGDAFQRQFYGGTNVPSYRILPAQRGGGA